MKLFKNIVNYLLKLIYLVDYSLLFCNLRILTHDYFLYLTTAYLTAYGPRLNRQFLIIDPHAPGDLPSYWVIIAPITIETFSMIKISSRSAITKEMPH